MQKQALHTPEIRIPIAPPPRRVQPRSFSSRVEIFCGVSGAITLLATIAIGLFGGAWGTYFLIVGGLPPAGIWLGTAGAALPFAIYTCVAFSCFGISSALRRSAAPPLGEERPLLGITNANDVSLENEGNKFRVENGNVVLPLSQATNPTVIVEERIETEIPVVIQKAYSPSEGSPQITLLTEKNSDIDKKRERPKSFSFCEQSAPIFLGGTVSEGSPQITLLTKKNSDIDKRRERPKSFSFCEQSAPIFLGGTVSKGHQRSVFDHSASHIAETDSTPKILKK